MTEEERFEKWFSEKFAGKCISVNSLKNIPDIRNLLFSAWNAALEYRWKRMAEDSVLLTVPKPSKSSMFGIGDGCDTRVAAIDSWKSSGDSRWEPIDGAPKDGTPVDLWCKKWNSYNDSWEYKRFPDCFWRDYKHLENVRAQWLNVTNGWFPTHFMSIPEPPSSEE